MKGYGPKKIYDEIESVVKSNGNSTNISSIFKEKIAKASGIETTIIQILCDAFLFEPAIIISGTETQNATASNYIHGRAPTELHGYLEDFAAVNTKITCANDGPALCQCSGTNNASGHKYLGFEGTFKCKHCEQSFCKTCSFVPKLDKEKKRGADEKVYYKDCNEVICLCCFRLSRLGSQNETDDEETSIGIDDMRSQLSEKYGVQIDINASLVETVEIYNEYISSESNVRNIHDDAVAKVKFPVYPSKALFNESNVLQKVGSFSLSAGGSFISDTDLVKDEDLAGTLELVASFLNFDKSGLRTTSNNEVAGEYHHLPTIIQNFAYDARVDAGYRLLKRCARHACDPKTQSMYDQSVDLFKCDDGIGITLSCSIAASMKNESYNVKVAMTKDKLLACQCQCKASGSVNGEDRVLCVHVLPPLLLLTLFLIDGLSQNILVELSHRWDEHLESSLPPEDIEKVKDSILALIKGNGGDDSTLQSAKASSSVHEMLESYSVGTEKAKQFRQKPKPSELIPLRLMTFESNSGKIKDTLKKRGIQKKNVMLLSIIVRHHP